MPSTGQLVLVLLALTALLTENVLGAPDAAQLATATDAGVT